jgi:ketosteroid isomerase-like protein
MGYQLSVDGKSCPPATGRQACVPCLPAAVAKEGAVVELEFVRPENPFLMKTVLAYTLLLATVTSSLAMGHTRESVSNGDAAARREILKLLKERRDAFYRGDIAKFSEFEADDFTRITESGRLVAKKQQLASIKSWMTASSVSHTTSVYADHDLKLGIYGDVAVLTGRLTEKERNKSGQTQTEQSRFTEIWVYRRGRWQTLHNHYTTITR